ncbi:MAG: ATP-dependent DNA helicase RecG [Bacteroidetes bacterium]|nr:ATP-dependent DNA helicase RecG [Bacteroidota bacterium]
MTNRDNIKLDSQTPLQYIKGVGPKRAEALSDLGITSIKDLLYYFPRGYLDRSQVVRIADLRKHVENGRPVTVFAEVFRQEARRTKRGNKLIFLLTVKDESGFLTCVWFEGFQWLKNTFENGEFLALSAVPALDKLKRPQFIHPQYDRLKSAEEDEPDWGKLFNTGSIIPKYSSSAELERVGLDSRGFRRIIRNAVDRHISSIDEILSSDIIQRQDLCDEKSALKSIHFPPDFNELENARRRLKFDELFFLQLMLALRKRNAQQQLRGMTYDVESKLAHQLVNALNFELTKAQRKVLREIIDDLKSPYPMNRLLQGDVGSGKTIVALCTALLAVENGFQTAFMAPTEILAEQHYQTITELLKSLPVNVRLLVGGQRKKLRDDILEDIRRGSAQIVVGTHALVEEKVDFLNLGLVIVDEQHRFGVMQRAGLRSKGTNPDTLIMTATPIPRTLAMTLYGDLEVSVIDEMPANRKPVRTALRTEKEKARVYQFVKEEISRGRQAYIVFPLIEESEKIDLKAAAREYEHLQKNIFPEFKLGLLHGRMKSEMKEAVMHEFKKGEMNILISTTVIEVGVDVPNASIMIIENAERFGLAQLHQLRGRVGRGPDQSYCILIADYGWFDMQKKGGDILEILGEKENARVRLETMVQTTDGFKISEIDLKLRGPGEFFGTRQSGLPGLRIANPVDDAELLTKARKEAFDLVKNDPHIRREENIYIKYFFEKKFRNILELGKIG